MKSIILTGGTSKRFGSDKSLAKINGSTLLEVVSSNLDDLIIVGPQRDIKAIYVQEEPMHSGPVAAIGEGMKFVNSELVAIFATDMPFGPRILKQLESALIHDAALPVDSNGIVQPLAGLYRTQELIKALKSFDSLTNKSMKELITKLNFDQVFISDSDLLHDVDSKEDLVKAVEIAGRFIK